MHRVGTLRDTCRRNEQRLSRWSSATYVWATIPLATYRAPKYWLQIFAASRLFGTISERSRPTRQICSARSPNGSHPCGAPFLARLSGSGSKFAKLVGPEPCPSFGHYRSQPGLFHLSATAQTAPQRRLSGIAFPQQEPTYPQLRLSTRNRFLVKTGFQPDMRVFRGPSETVKFPHESEGDKGRTSSGCSLSRNCARPVVDRQCGRCRSARVPVGRDHRRVWSTYSVWVFMERLSRQRKQPNRQKNLRGTLSRSWTGSGLLGKPKNGFILRLLPRLPLGILL